MKEKLNENGLTVIGGPDIVDGTITDIAMHARDVGIDVLKGGVYNGDRLDRGLLSDLKEAGNRAGLPVMAHAERIPDIPGISEFADYVSMSDRGYKILGSAVPPEKNVVINMTGSSGIARMLLIQGLSVRRNDNLILLDDPDGMVSGDNYTNEIMDFSERLGYPIFVDFTRKLDENSCYTLVNAGVSGIMVDYRGNGTGELIERIKVMYSSRDILF